MVKWVKISEIADVGTGSGNRQDENENGKYPFYVRSQIVLRNDNYEFDEEAIVIPGEGGIGDIFHYVVGKYALHQRAYRIHITSINVLTKYVYYYFTVFFKSYILGKSLNAAVSSIRKPMLLDFEIPLPSLSEQQRIVDILDKFEGMVENVEKELLLRQKQCEYYREKMMNCLRCDSVKWVKIGDEGSFYSGLSGKNKNDFVNGNAKFVTYMNVYTNVALNFNIEDKVQIRDTERQNTIEYGDILFTGSSETPDECGMSCVVTQVPEESIYLNSFCFGYRFNSIENILPDYCKHLFRSSMIRSAIAKTANGVTRFNVSKKLFANIEIPVPSLSKQQEIVDKLDKFEEMISTLKKELELRKKQYEYYREKLLTFE